MLGIDLLPLCTVVSVMMWLEKTRYAMFAIPFCNTIETVVLCLPAILEDYDYLYPSKKTATKTPGLVGSKPLLDFSCVICLGGPFRTDSSCGWAYCSCSLRSKWQLGYQMALVSALS